ncbi:MAG: hypothetical protein JWN99_101, partial [Ilumatobacteraceae bacterium]|nr:hypothetical protein [Ilumatobacteraceae bacterium]
TSPCCEPSVISSTDELLKEATESFDNQWWTLRVE